MAGSYAEISQDCRTQVDATIWLIKHNIWFGMDKYQEQYLREHISNTVQSCLYTEAQQKRERLEQVAQQLQDRYRADITLFLQERGETTPGLYSYYSSLRIDRVTDLLEGMVQDGLVETCGREEESLAYRGQVCYRLKQQSIGEEGQEQL